jgi:YD repeat-containing protein
MLDFHTATTTSFNNVTSDDLDFSYDGFGRLTKITTHMRGGIPVSGEETTFSCRRGGSNLLGSISFLDEAA